MVFRSNYSQQGHQNQTYNECMKQSKTLSKTSISLAAASSTTEIPVKSNPQKIVIFWE
jgi:molybdopterin biosynthesis enzyme